MMIDLRKVPLLLFLLALFTTCQSSKTAREDTITMKQNLIIILPDDMAFGDISAYGNDKFNTPNIDKLAGQGVKLTDFYVPVPYCAPSRATLLTGRFPLRHGMTQNPAPDSGIDSIGLSDDETTLGESLQNKGYAARLIGKWHLGHQEKYFPVNHGFDEYYGIQYSNDMRPVQIVENTDTLEYPVDQALLTKRYTEKAIEFIRSNKNRALLKKAVNLWLIVTKERRTT
ncbi:MAG: sulfatase-like hydrolase/transferase [Cyclobacteriaceae bacterium]|nr:sulfatase-like hydrolase/transferase [Cyclobacteriaceae bacterium]